MNNLKWALKNSNLLTLGIMGVVGGILYFTLYPSVDPYRYVDASLGKEKAGDLAVKIARQLTFIDGTDIPEASVVQQNRLLKPVLNNISRVEMDQHLGQIPFDKSILFPWRAGFAESELAGSNEKTENSANGENREHRSNQSLQILLSQQGEWLGLINHRKVLPQNVVALSHLESAFSGIKSYIETKSHHESILADVLEFDASIKSSGIPITTASLIKHIQNKQPLKIGKNTAFAIANSYLKNMEWQKFKFEIDSVSTVNYGRKTAARLHMKRDQPFFGKDLYLTADILPTGSLLQLQPVLPGVNYTGETTFDKIFGVTTILFILLLAGIVIVLFFKRLRARVIDLKTSLIVAIPTSALLPAIILMSLIKQNEFNSAGTIEQILIYFLITGISGALGVLVFFILVSVGESVTRQVWADKIMAFDLIRSGFLINKPIGAALVRSVSGVFVLLGIWGVLQFAIPNLYPAFEEAGIFLTDEVVLAPLSSVIFALLLSSVGVLLIFSILGSQLYKIQASTFWLYLFSFVAFPLVNILPMPFIPPYYGLVLKAVMGLCFTYIFLNWGMLTTLLSLFQFLLITGITTGWVPVSSPDLPAFVVALLLPAVFLTVGLVAIKRGKTEQVLPRYVPHYIEELARENRMQQELEIAKEVQASFLPQSMPHITPLDIAAICHPAYETGGDYFDVIQLDEHRLGIAIGDVSGKGIQAAFYMTLAKGIIHSLCREIDQPVKLLNKANEIFYQNSSKNTFISMIYGVFDTEDNTFCFARAGHNPLLIKKQNGSHVIQLKPEGLGLGITNSEKFYKHLKEEKIYLETGDTIILFTDGLNEALNKNHTFYGMNRLSDLVMASRAANANDLLVEIEQDISDFVGNSEQHDDLTLVILQLRENAGDVNGSELKPITTRNKLL